MLLVSANPTCRFWQSAQGRISQGVSHMFSWIRRLFARKVTTYRRPAKAAKRLRGFRPELENLEDRLVPTFLAPVSMAAGGNPSGIAVADYNGDGKSDMAVVNQPLA